MYYRQTRYCRWCGDEYIPQRDNGRDGFCSALCRVSLHRAYKRWLRQRNAAQGAARRQA